jgi:hypothetical protein
VFTPIDIGALLDALPRPVRPLTNCAAATNHRSEAIMRRIGMTRAADRDFVHPDLAVDDPLRAHVVYVLERPPQ